MKKLVRTDRAGAQGSHRRLHAHHQDARAPRRRRRALDPGTRQVAANATAVPSPRSRTTPLALCIPRRARSSRTQSRRSRAYLALAQPGRSCLLERSKAPIASRATRSSGSTTSRRASFDDDPAMLERHPRADRQVRARHDGAAVPRRRGVRVHLRCGARRSNGSARSRRPTSRSPTRSSSFPGRGSSSITSRTRDA